MLTDQKHLSRRAVLIAALIAASGARAQSAPYPTRPIRLTVPYAAGGNTDVISRVVAEALSSRLGQPIVIENRPGAGVTLGTGVVAKAAPDGYNLLVTTLAHATNPNLFRSLPYDSEKDFAPIGVIGLTPLVLVVNPQSEARDLTGFLAMLRAKPGITFGSAGNGSPMHLAPELLGQMTSTKVQHVSYRGEAPALNDVVAGHITFSISTVVGASSLVNGGMLRAIAVASLRRAEILPQAPTFAEAGLPGFEAYTWTVLMAPKGTPSEVIERLNRELVATLAETPVRSRLAEPGVELGRSFSPGETGDFIRAEATKWAPIIRTSGVTLD
jgi:tripartite-type tricarboxylate transporter receptor subunit TctC